MSETVKKECNCGNPECKCGPDCKCCSSQVSTPKKAKKQKQVILGGKSFEQRIDDALGIKKNK